MSVGLNIRKRRLELRMSQQELADALGYKTRSTITKIESGENDVSHKKLQRFAVVLDTTVEELISGYVPEKEEFHSIGEIGESERNKNIAIILAGGNTGNNLQNVPSQFVNVQGKPIIIYSMETYQSHPLIDDIYVVCLKGWENIVKAYAKQFHITKMRGIIQAGDTGVRSLKNALDSIEKNCELNDIIFIQEATRPMVKIETISTLLKTCTESGSATISHSMRDYVQFSVVNGKAEYVNREVMVAMQSPEAHRFSLMKEVFEKAIKKSHDFTESCCTMLLHNMGYEINFIESNINNIKIAKEEDIAAFSALIRN